jgi:hypothetical protein
MALRIGGDHFTANICYHIQMASDKLFFRFSKLPFEHLRTSGSELISHSSGCHGSRIEGLVNSCDTFEMSWIRHKFCTSEIAVIGILLAIMMMVIFSESARAAGFGLFQQVADSYLIMSIDTMSMSFICF